MKGTPYWLTFNIFIIYPSTVSRIIIVREAVYEFKPLQFERVKIKPFEGVCIMSGGCVYLVMNYAPPLCYLKTEAYVHPAPVNT